MREYLVYKDFFVIMQCEKNSVNSLSMIGFEDRKFYRYPTCSIVKSVGTIFKDTILDTPYFLQSIA